MKFSIFTTAVVAALTGMAVAGELKIEVLTEVPEADCQRKTKTGDNVIMQYKGMLTDDSVFDKSYGRGPFEFQLGAGRVIKGWDQGLLDMCIGEKRKLTIPPELGYGERGFPPVIPANSVLIFEVELEGIKGYKKDEL